MNYLFRLDDLIDNPPLGTFLCHLKIEEWQRPSKGTELYLPISTSLWKVVRVSPPENPAGQQNTYYVEKA